MALDLETEAGVTAAQCRVVALWATLAAGRGPTIAELIWLCQTAYAALVRLPAPPPVWTADEQIPAWLLRLAPDQES